jgi:quinol monooxygenase YgiN
LRAVGITNWWQYAYVLIAHSEKFAGYNAGRLLLASKGVQHAPAAAVAGNRICWRYPRGHWAGASEAASTPGRAVIFIVVKFETKPEWTDRWPDLVAAFTAATRAEPGNLWFEWSRSLDDPAEYVLVEAFRDGEAGSVHVNSDHFRRAMRELPQALVSTPRIISQTLDATGWSPMGEMSVD